MEIHEQQKKFAELVETNKEARSLQKLHNYSFMRSSMLWDIQGALNLDFHIHNLESKYHDFIFDLDEDLFESETLQEEYSHIADEIIELMSSSMNDLIKIKDKLDSATNELELFHDTQMDITGLSEYVQHLKFSDETVVLSPVNEEQEEKTFMEEMGESYNIVDLTTMSMQEILVHLGNVAVAGHSSDMDNEEFQNYIFSNVETIINVLSDDRPTDWIDKDGNFRSEDLGDVLR